IAAYLLGDYWTDLSFSFDMMLTGGEFWASVRYNPDTETDYAYDRILGKPKDRSYVARRRPCRPRACGAPRRWRSSSAS
ncbi:MAG: hypothetical protein HY655_06010, partial [Acidobacteria bacterium]|nr:hypothetical protein [Acidobacteriota bacterium]